jgi:Ca2+-binding EF-hand superfamily protein
MLKGKNYSKQKIQEIIKIIDINDSGEINYTEFLVANF